MRMLLLTTIASLAVATPALPQSAIKMPIAPGLWSDTNQKCANARYGYVFDGKRWGSFYFYGPNGTLGPNAELKPITGTMPAEGGFTYMQVGGGGSAHLKSIDANRALYRVGIGAQETEEELIRCAFNSLSPRMQAGLRKHAPAIAN